MKISDLDKNFKAEPINGQDFHFIDVTKAPFSLEGLPWRDGDTPYYRLPSHITPEALAKSMTSLMPETEDMALTWGKTLVELAKHTSGACVRFRTNSKSIALRATLRCSCDMSHMPRMGSAGFDLYQGADSEPMIHVASVAVDPSELNGNVQRVFNLSTEKVMKNSLLNLPLYGGVVKLELGLEPDAVLEAPLPHKVPKPVLFYGSSITQGGCASRPGNQYSSLLCRAVDAEQINQGYSGNAKGQPLMAETIASLDLSCLVLDYDHNAPTPAHLRKTHENFFRIIRGKHPDLPVIFLTRPSYWQNPEEVREREEVIRTTWLHAIKNGDTHVWYIPGRDMIGSVDYDACTVDRCHPNDIGFYRMYRRVLPVLKEALGLA